LSTKPAGSLRMRRCVHFAAALCLAWVANTGWAATYYVSLYGSDSNPGTEVQPWRTPTKAVATAAGGDTVLFARGDYGESTVIGRGGSLGKYLTFDGQSIATNTHFRIQAPYVRIQNFAVSGQTNAGVALVWVYRKAHYFQMSNCVLDARSRKYVSGIAFDPGVGAAAALDTNAASHCVISNNTIKNILGTTYIIVAGAYNTISGNNLRDGADVDWFRVFGHDHVIRGNHCVNSIEAVPSVGNHPDFVQSFSDNGEHAFNVLIDGNTVVDGYCQLAQLTDDGGLERVRDWTFRNNIFVRLLAGATVNIPGARFHNNLFYRCGTGVVLGYGYYPIATNGACRGAARRGEVYNNAFVECGTTMSTKQGWYCATAAAGYTNALDLRADYNYVCTTNWLPKQSGPPLDTFHFWEPHGVNGGDARLADCAGLDFRPGTGSVLIGTGTNLYAQFQTDHSENPRPREGAWTIGPFAEITTPPSTNPVPAAPSGLRQAPRPSSPL
jgi:hypothetical protein